MDHPKNIESTLNALLLNASELKSASDDLLASAELSSKQERLLNDLFNAWNSLTEDEKKNLLATKVESKVLELAKKNKECLQEVHTRLSPRKAASSDTQLDLI